MEGEGEQKSGAHLEKGKLMNLNTAMSEAIRGQERLI